MSSQNPYYQNANPYQQQEQHEMQQYGQPYASQPASSRPPAMSQQDFLAQVAHVRAEMRSLGADVEQIAALHQRALTSTESGAGSMASSQLEQLVAQTQIKNTGIRDQIKALKGDAERTADATRALKVRQFESLNNDFKSEVQKYLSEESQYKQRYREQIARQYRIANPEASEAEVNEAADRNWGDEGIFQQALRTNRSGQANAVLGNVRARHNELQQIEKSLIELAGLFQDLNTLVIQQDPIIEHTATQVEAAVGHLDDGNKQIEIGIKHARKARKWKWYCLLVCLLIVIAIGVGVGVGVGLTKSTAGK